MPPATPEPCVLWFGTLTVKGYPQRKENGRTIRVHREVCERRHGPPPTPDHHAAHSCGRRACVEPTHLDWKTAAENNLDRLAHGTAPLGERSGTAKLTASDIPAIRRSVATQEALALSYGVSQAAISCVVRRKTWRHVP